MPTVNPFSQTNTSPSKAMYSFGKSNRPSLAKKVDCDTFYNIPQTKSRRQASIGYGRKITIDQLNKSQFQIPPPGTYNIDDFADTNKTHHKGFTLGVGRQETQNLSFVQFDKSVPKNTTSKPQDKALDTLLEKESLLKCLLTTTVNLSLDQAAMILPVAQILRENIASANGLHQRQKDSILNLQRDFLKQKESQVPGPGRYTPRNSTWTDVGHMTESKYSSTGNRVFAMGNRSTIFEEGPKKTKDIPGPGMYQSFSDFGSIHDFEPKRHHRTIRPSTSDAYKK